MNEEDQVIQEVEKAIVESIVPIAKSLAEATAQPNQLISTDIQAKQIEHQLSQYMLLAKKHIREGFTYCIESIKELAVEEVSINLEVLETELANGFAKLDSVAAIKDMSSKVVEGNSWKELLGLSDGVLQILYKGAKRLFDAGRHPQAEAAFFFLTTVDFTQYPFWLGLGHAAYHLGNLNQAINAYEMASDIEPTNVWPQIYMANCFEALNDYEESLSALLKAETELKNCQERDLRLEADLRDRIANARSRA